MVATIAIYVFAVALFAYHYALLANVENQKPSLIPTATANPSLNPTSTPTSESTDEPKVKVFFIDWDPHGYHPIWFYNLEHTRLHCTPL